jgi:hypothetical protein
VTERQDALGAMLLRGLGGQDAAEIADQDDGYIAVSISAPWGYFAPFRPWPASARVIEADGPFYCAVLEQDA